MARRIQGRAVRRAGELLKTFQTGPDGGRSKENGIGADTVSSQRQAAEAAGMSKRQEVTAVRVSNVPEPDFEAAVESEDPSSVSRSPLGVGYVPGVDAGSLGGLLTGFAFIPFRNDFRIGVAVALLESGGSPFPRRSRTTQDPVTGSFVRQRPRTRAREGGSAADERHEVLDAQHRQVLRWP